MVTEIRKPGLSPAKVKDLFKRGYAATGTGGTLAICLLQDEEELYVFRRAFRWITLESVTGEIYARRLRRK